MTHRKTNRKNITPGMMKIHESEKGRNKQNTHKTQT